MKTTAILAIAFTLITTSVASAQERYRFRNSDSERRYNDARRDQQRYESERSYYDAYAGSLERSDRYYRPLRRGADAAFNAGTYFVPRYGSSMRRAYGRGMDYMRGDRRR